MQHVDQPIRIIGGKELVETSYGKAKEEAAERSEARRATKQAKEEARVGGSDA